MENLSRKSAKCKNRVGFSEIEFTSEAEVATVDSRYSSRATVIRTVSFRSAGCFGTIDAKQVYMSDNSHDGVHDMEITCSFYGTPEQVDDRLNELTFGRYLVRLRDRNGRLWLAGDKIEPLHFEYAHIGDAGHDGAHEYQLRFFGTLSIPLSATE